MTDADNNKEIIDKYINKYNNYDVVWEISFLNTNYKKVLVQYTDNE